MCVPTVKRNCSRTFTYCQGIITLAKYCIQGVYRQNIGSQRLTGCWEGVGEPCGSAVWQFEGHHVTLPNPMQTQKGRSAGRGGSCPTARVWVRSATPSSYESSRVGNGAPNTQNPAPQPGPSSSVTAPETVHHWFLADTICDIIYRSTKTLGRCEGETVRTI
jgi:hypothetical protein